MPRPVWHPDSLADRLPFLRRRGELLRATRAFFAERGYTEVETPCAVSAPGEEVHLRAFATTQELPDGATRPLWLHTSPEFAMKRLLVAGAGPIFQFARVWRNGEGSDLHAPEFTMLEWYAPLETDSCDTAARGGQAAGMPLRDPGARACARMPRDSELPRAATPPPRGSAAGSADHTGTAEVRSVAVDRHGTAMARLVALDRPGTATDRLVAANRPGPARDPMVAAERPCTAMESPIAADRPGTATDRLVATNRPGAAMDRLIAETTDLLRTVLPPVVTCRGVRTDLSRIERLTIAEAFSRYVGADLLATADDAPALAAAAGTRLRDGESWEDLFFRLLLERVEPRIGRDHPTFLTHWPAAQAALARRDPADPRVAERFELFVCGIELANAFVELTDAVEQRARFEADRSRRHALYGSDWPLDDDFLAALAHGMPNAAGIAMGFDRLAMIAAGADRIGQVLWLG
jgi:elongation factor P--beta-lysine ligase